METLALQSSHQTDDNTVVDLLGQLKLSNEESQVICMSLHEAVKKDDYTTAELLLQRKADVNALLKNNLTPLHIAIDNRSQKMVRLLLDHGANVNPHRKSSSSKTPLFLAVERNSVEISRMLLEEGALVKKALTRKITAFGLAKQNSNKPMSELLIQHAIKQLNLSDYKVKRRSDKKMDKTKTKEKCNSLLVEVLKKNTEILAKKYGLEKDAPISVAV